MSRATQAARAYWAARLPLPCQRCGGLVTGLDPWDVGHRYPQRDYPALAADPDNQWPEHRSCNRRAGATIPAPITHTRRGFV